MGTSAARRGPKGPRWSLARRAATRYLAHEESRPPAARELAASYVAALEETAVREGGDLLGAFRRTRKAAQNLGDFLTQVHFRGWGKALAALGLEGAGGRPGEGAVVPLTSAVLGTADGSLEAAVVRTALAQVLGEIWAAPTPLGAGAPAQGVRRFLAGALYLRLVLDLGETLEAAARDAARLRQDLEAFRQWVEQAMAPDSGPPPPGTSQWPGLAGWLWVTLVLQDLIEGIRGQGIGNRE